jgi:hypothetical protein
MAWKNGCPWRSGPFLMLSCGVIAVVGGGACWLYAMSSGMNPRGPHPDWEEPLAGYGFETAAVVGPIVIMIGLIWIAVRRLSRKKGIESPFHDTH